LFKPLPLQLPHQGWSNCWRSILRLGEGKEIFRRHGRSGQRGYPDDGPAHFARSFLTGHSGRRHQNTFAGWTCDFNFRGWRFYVRRFWHDINLSRKVGSPGSTSTPFSSEAFQQHFNSKLEKPERHAQEYEPNKHHESLMFIRLLPCFFRERFGSS
jgi:hypothetical protein